MARLKLGFISAFNERVEPLMDGTVQPEGIELIPTYSHPAETFWRQLRFGEFEVAELSFSSYLIAHSRGQDMIALPVFPSRRLFQTEIGVHVDAGVDTPGQLAGKRLGVPEYQQTAALWTRGILEHDFGVSQYDIHWYMERGEEMSHGGATGFRPPPGISFQRIPSDKSLLSMLSAHELDAAAVRGPWALVGNVIDRSSRIPGQGAGADKIKPLFPDRMAEGKRFFDKYGFVPVNHAYVVRADIHEKYPWVVFNLYKAFVKAKEVARQQLLERIPTALFFGPEYLARTQAVFGADPFPYGIEANRPMLETMIRFSMEQGLIAEAPDVASLFAESTRNL